MSQQVKVFAIGVFVLISSLCAQNRTGKEAVFFGAYIQYLGELRDANHGEKGSGFGEAFAIDYKRKMCWERAAQVWNDKQLSYNRLSDTIISSLVFFGAHAIDDLDSTAAAMQRTQMTLISAQSGQPADPASVVVDNRTVHERMEDYGQMTGMVFNISMLCSGLLVDTVPDKEGHASYLLLTKKEIDAAKYSLTLAFGNSVKTGMNKGKDDISNSAAFLYRLISERHPYDPDRR